MIRLPFCCLYLPLQVSCLSRLYRLCFAVACIFSDIYTPGRHGRAPAESFDHLSTSLTFPDQIFRLFHVPGKVPGAIAILFPPLPPLKSRSRYYSSLYFMRQLQIAGPGAARTKTQMPAAVCCENHLRLKHSVRLYGCIYLFPCGRIAGRAKIKQR